MKLSPNSFLKGNAVVSADTLDKVIGIVKPFVILPPVGPEILIIAARPRAPLRLVTMVFSVDSVASGSGQHSLRINGQWRICFI